MAGQFWGMRKIEYLCNLNPQSLRRTAEFPLRIVDGTAKALLAGGFLHFFELLLLLFQLRLHGLDLILLLFLLFVPLDAVAHAVSADILDRVIQAGDFVLQGGDGALLGLNLGLPLSGRVPVAGT